MGEILLGVEGAFSVIFNYFEEDTVQVENILLSGFGIIFIRFMVPGPLDELQFGFTETI